MWKGTPSSVESPQGTHGKLASVSHSKRSDLQGIRGAAILYVLMMHLKPGIFRIGFIGVDIFFVLSGFLITKILREREFSSASIRIFYVRRFKRIVPVYMLTVVAVYIYGYFYLLYPDQMQLLRDLQWVCTFSSNMQPIYLEIGYWDQLSMYRFFVHTWSLAVELQYYSIVPAIIGSTTCFAGRWRIATFILIAVASLLFQLLTVPDVSYGFLLSRIWQFMCGSIAYEVSESQLYIENRKIYRLLSTSDAEGQVTDQENKESINKANERRSALSSLTATVLFCCLTALVLTSPPLVKDHIARVLSTLAAAVMIFLNTNAYCITNKPIVYCGDISYVLYLIHWPLIVATRYYCDTEQLSTSAIILVVVCSLLISMIAHHTVESFFISRGFLPALVCVIGTYLYIIGTIPMYAVEPNLEFKALNNSSKEYAISWNLKEASKVFYELPCRTDKETPVYTNFTLEPQLRCVDFGNGTATILLIGNSIAYRAYPLIHDILGGRYRTFRLYSRSSCPPLSDWCPDFTNATRMVVEHEKPDILINIHHSLHEPIVAPIKDLQSDPIFNQFQSNVDFFSNYSKHIVIDMPYYKFPETIVGAVLAKRIKQGLPPGDDLAVSWEQYMNQTQYHRKRIASIVCQKCIINDVAQVLFHNGIFYAYDPKTLLARLGDGSHMTPVGLELLRPSYKKILDKLLSTLPN